VRGARTGNSRRDRNQGGGGSQDAQQPADAQHAATAGGVDRFDGMGSGGGAERDMPGYSEQQAFTGEPERSPDCSTWPTQASV